jgi:hypothetical protein
MRHRNAWAMGLALSLGLCAVGIALGQESAGIGGTWFGRVFGRSSPAAAPKEKEEKVAAAPSPSAVRSQALADLLRRLEVCDRLQEIAFENSDPELKRKADQLEQRAKDLYDQRVNGVSGGPTLDEDSLERSLAAKSGVTPLAGSASKLGSGQASAEGRK